MGTTDGEASTEAPLLHILAQDGFHDPAYVAGTKPALMRLRDAIDRAIAHGAAATDEVFPCDGEGFWCIVLRCSEDQMDTMPFGYLSEMAGGPPGPMPEWTHAPSFQAIAEMVALRDARSQAADRSQGTGERAPEPASPRAGSPHR
jgi:hypothetical protein